MKYHVDTLSVHIIGQIIGPHKTQCSPVPMHSTTMTLTQGPHSTVTQLCTHHFQHTFDCCPHMPICNHTQPSWSKCLQKIAALKVYSQSLERNAYSQISCPQVSKSIFSTFTDNLLHNSRNTALSLDAVPKGIDRCQPKADHHRSKTKLNIGRVQLCNNILPSFETRKVFRDACTHWDS